MPDSEKESGKDRRIKAKTCRDHWLWERLPLTINDHRFTIFRKFQYEQDSPDKRNIEIIFVKTFQIFWNFSITQKQSFPVFSQIIIYFQRVWTN